MCIGISLWFSLASTQWLIFMSIFHMVFAITKPSLTLDSLFTLFVSVVCSLIVEFCCSLFCIQVLCDKGDLKTSVFYFSIFSSVFHIAKTYMFVCIYIFKIKATHTHIHTYTHRHTHTHTHTHIYIYIKVHKV